MTDAAILREQSDDEGLPPVRRVGTSLVADVPQLRSLPFVRRAGNND